MKTSVGSAIARGLLALSTTCTLGWAAEPQLPEPGWYRIDSEMTRSSGNSPIILVTRTDGATGTVTTTQTMRGTDQSSTSIVVGSGPNRFCSRRGAPIAPPAMAGTTPTRCDARMSAPGSIASQCPGLEQQDDWTRLDGTRWQRKLQVRQAPNGGVPASSATLSAMAPVLAKLKEQSTTGRPEEQAAARQQLAALEQSLGGGTAASDASTIHYDVRETWTRESTQCPPGS
ncbi:hypothetical protein BH10PSE17_BH10PSE17_10910 [soil metagenome]